MPRKKYSFRLTEKAKENVERYHKGKTLSESINIMLETYSTPETTLEIETCENYTEYPNNPKFMVCLQDPKKKKILSKEHCKKCQLYKIIKIPLTSREKLEEQISDLQKQKETLKTGIAKLKEEYQSVNVPNLQEGLKASAELLKEKNETISKQAEEIARLQTDCEFLREKQQQTKIQPISEPKPISESTFFRGDAKKGMIYCEGLGTWVYKGEQCDRCKTYSLATHIHCQQENRKRGITI